MAVVLGHYNNHGLFALHLFTFSDAAVDIFFALSSFTLCMVYGAGERRSFDPWMFAVARLARVYPLYLLSTVLFMAAGLAWRSGALGTDSLLVTMRHLLSQLLMVSSLPVPYLSGQWNVAAWSVPVEVLCYAAIFPVLFSIPKGVVPGRLLIILVVVSALLSLSMYIRHYNPAVNGIGYARPADRVAYWIAVCRGSTMFVAGWAAYMIYISDRGVAKAAGMATDGLALVMVYCVVGESFGFLRSQAIVLFAPFLIMGLMDSRSLTARLLSLPPVHFLGLISYSVYLLHLLVSLTMSHEFPELDSHEVMRIGFPVIGTLIAATMTYYLVERPARTAIRRIAGSRSRLRSFVTAPRPPGAGS